MHNSLEISNSKWAAKVGANLTLSTAGARIVRMKQRYCPTATANDWYQKMPPSCRAWVVGGLGFAATMPRFPPNRFAGSSIHLCTKAVVCILPFSEGRFAGQKSSIERVSRILKSPKLALISRYVDRGNLVFPSRGEIVQKVTYEV